MDLNNCPLSCRWKHYRSNPSASNSLERLQTTDLTGKSAGHFESVQMTFLSGLPPIQYWSLNQNFGTPSVGSQNGFLKTPSTLEVPNLQILRTEDLPGMSISSIVPFDNIDPKLVHRLSQREQLWPRGVFLLITQPLFRVRLSASLKSTALALWCRKQTSSARQTKKKN